MYIFWILHQTTTPDRCDAQHVTLYIFWILHQTTTLGNFLPSNLQLYIFWILHQTTTDYKCLANDFLLYIFWILHQTTTTAVSSDSPRCCISFESYIKPQPSSYYNKLHLVVYLLNPTSNHNLLAFKSSGTRVVYLLNPTSNHNPVTIKANSEEVVYLLNPTSNHNSWLSGSFHDLLYIFWILHQTTTSWYLFYRFPCCISFESYIKPQHQ